MAADLGVNQKTIRRDLDLFRGLGFPLEETVGERGRKSWRITAATNQPPLGFRFDEAAALYLSRRLLEPLAGTVFWDQLKAARSLYEYFHGEHGAGLGASHQTGWTALVTELFRRPACHSLAGD